MSQGNTLFHTANPEFLELLGEISSAGSILLAVLILLIVSLLVHIVMGLISRRVTHNRGRRGGFWWGFCLGVVGIIVAAVRPKE